MPQGWISLSKIAGMHGLKTADAEQAARNVGVRAKRGAALLSPPQQEMLHPELRRMAAEKAIRMFRRPDRPAKGSAVFRVTEERAEFITDEHDDVGHLGFNNDQMRQQLKPLRDEMEDDGEGESA